MTSPLFEPRFYERAAQRYLAQLAAVPVWVNVPWGLTGNPANRPEVDGIWTREGRMIAAEIKAHRVCRDTAEEILAKYRGLGFRDLIVIAPSFAPAAASYWTGGSRLPVVEPVPFTPSLGAIEEFYRGDWQRGVPDWVHATLASGLHHVRFMLTVPSVAGHVVVGQRRTRIYDTATITRAIAALPSPPARVLWTPQRFTIPRDLIARRSHVTALGGYIPVDIDGDRLHAANHACQLTPGQAGCPHCVRYALREYARLRQALGDAQWVEVLFSGGRGIHAYLGGGQQLRARLLKVATEHKLRIDRAVTASVKTTISLPGSLHAATTHAVMPVGPAGQAALPALVITC